MRRWITLVLIACALVGCGATETVAEAPSATETPAPTPMPTCQMLAQAYGDEIALILDTWEDAKKIAGSTARMSMAAPLATLQNIKRDTAAMIVPDCVQQTHALLASAMDYTIEAYLSFLRNEGDEIVNLRFDLANQMMTAYNGNINKLVRGEPLPNDAVVITPTP